MVFLVFLVCTNHGKRGDCDGPRMVAPEQENQENQEFSMFGGGSGLRLGDVSTINKIVFLQIDLR